MKRCESTNFAHHQWEDDSVLKPEHNVNTPPHVCTCSAADRAATDLHHGAQ